MCLGLRCRRFKSCHSDQRDAGPNLFLGSALFLCLIGRPMSSASFLVPLYISKVHNGLELWTLDFSLHQLLSSYVRAGFACFFYAKICPPTNYGIEKDIAELTDILGHSNINTTIIYIVATASKHRGRLGKYAANKKTAIKTAVEYIIRIMLQKNEQILLNPIREESLF